MSLNKCMIIGNLGRDPEMRYTPSGQAVTQFTVATNRNFRDQQGEWQKETEWFRVVVWGQQAERAAENLRKGNKVYVEGRIQTRQWEDQTGQKRYTTELVANQVSSLERRDRGDEEAPFPDDAPAGGTRNASGGPSSGGPSSGGPSSGGPASGGPASGTPSSGGSAARSSDAPASAGEDFDDLPF
jgi:single-strand DNA-binding protein